eukprot:m.48911 g.48911  ORF g.48911 m.48911 type:complete len:217 (+) comp12771_c0_seq1:112-762(+)
MARRSGGLASVLERREQLQRQMQADGSLLGTEPLLDCLLAVADEARTATLRVQKPLQLFLDRYETIADQVRALRVNKDDFEIIKLIGRGAFGDVNLARNKITDELCALKVQSKCELLKRTNTFYWEEREILARNASPWIIGFICSFHDRQNLYMAVEYVPGGDLVSLWEMYTFPEDWCRFYAAEVAMAISVVHNLGFAHRTSSLTTCSWLQMAMSS